jgi:DNA-binding IclR family transcriptional regulator
LVPGIRDERSNRSITIPRVESQVAVRSVTRAIDILLVLQNGATNLGRIAEQAGLSKPTAHRLLATLAYGKLVIQDPVSNEYMLGPGCIGIADAVMRGLGGLGPTAATTLEQLSHDSRESSALHVRTGVQRICVGQSPSSQPVRYTARVGGGSPLHTGAMGKILLAFTDPADLSDLLDRLPLPASTDMTITERGALEETLEQTRTDGYALSHGEHAVGVASISVPILGNDGFALAALSILGPNERLSNSKMQELLPMLLAGSLDITNALVYNSSDNGAAQARI